MARKPVLSCTCTVMSGLRRSIGRRSLFAWSHQSISPDCSAAAAVAASGMVCHSMRSKLAIFGPAEQAWRAAGARHVPGDAFPDRQRSRHPLVGHEAVRAAADHLGHLLGRLGARQTLRHDHAEHRRRSCRAHRAAAGTASSGGTGWCGRRAPTARPRRAISVRPNRRASPSAGCWRRSRAPAPACRRGISSPRAA